MFGIFFLKSLRQFEFYTLLKFFFFFFKSTTVNLSQLDFSASRVLDLNLRGNNG